MTCQFLIIDAILKNSSDAFPSFDDSFAQNDSVPQTPTRQRRQRHDSDDDEDEQRPILNQANLSEFDVSHNDDHSARAASPLPSKYNLASTSSPSLHQQTVVPTQHTSPTSPIYPPISRSSTVTSIHSTPTAARVADRIPMHSRTSSVAGEKSLSGASSPAGSVRHEKFGPSVLRSSIQLDPAVPAPLPAKTPTSRLSQRKVSDADSDNSGSTTGWDWVEDDNFDSGLIEPAPPLAVSSA